MIIRNIPIQMAVLLLALTVLGLSVHAEEDDIALIDLDRVFDAYYKTKLADAQLKEQVDGFKSEFNKMVEEYDALEQAFQWVRDESLNPAYSEEVRDQKKNEAADKLIAVREFEAKMRRFENSRKKQLDDQKGRMRQRLIAEIQEMINTYAEEQKYFLVLDTSGDSLNGVPFVVYNQGESDITETIIGLVNKGQ